MLRRSGLSTKIHHNKYWPFCLHSARSLTHSPFQRVCVVLARPGWPGAMPVSCVLPRGRSSSAGLQAASIGIVETAALTAGLQAASTTGIVETANVSIQSYLNKNF